jgi:hypothetical protein
MLFPLMNAHVPSPIVYYAVILSIVVRKTDIGKGTSIFVLRPIIMWCWKISRNTRVYLITGQDECSYLVVEKPQKNGTLL